MSHNSEAYPTRGGKIGQMSILANEIASFDFRRVYTVLALLFCCMHICSVTSTANALTIRQNGSTVLFRDDFEGGVIDAPWDNGASPGSWVEAAATKTLDSLSPGPFSGSKYGIVSRNSGSDVAKAQFTPVSSGKLELDTMVYIPGEQQWLTIALGSGLANSPNTPASNVHSYVTFHLNATHEVEDGAVATFPKMGFLYKNNEWMRLNIGYDFENPVNGYSVSLTNSDGSFSYTRDIINSDKPIDTLLLKFEANGNSAYFDAVENVPEPGSLAFVASLLITGAQFYRRDRRA